MDYAEALTEMYGDTMESLWRSARSMPEDKLDWRPEPSARTPRELLQEIAMTTSFSAELIRTKKSPAMPEGEKAEQKPSLDDLEKKHRAGAEDYLAAVKEFPENELHEKITLPWGEMNFLQVISYPYWNMVYHWGQINYVQTMYGDKNMP